MKATKNIAKNLTRLMAEHGIGTRKLADMTGTTPPTISRFATGKAYPGADMLLQMSEIFGVTIDSLYEGSD